MMQKIERIVLLSALSLSVATIVTGIIATAASAQLSHPTPRCTRCWHVTPGEHYAMTTTNDNGQLIKMSCTVGSNDNKGNLSFTCAEQ